MNEFHAAHRPDCIVQSCTQGMKARYLLAAVSTACGSCPTGLRCTSFWTTRGGTVEEIGWCNHCFNADCRRVTLPRHLSEDWRVVLSGVDAERLSPPWPAVRPALESAWCRGGPATGNPAGRGPLG
jgi:hypothetical protein